MAEATIPVDLRNPGQVFACLGLMEAAEVLFPPAEHPGRAVFGQYHWEPGETAARFTLTVDGVDADPVREVIAFLTRAEACALNAPRPPGSAVNAPGVDHTTAKWDVPTEPFHADRDVFPFSLPDSPAPLPVRLQHLDRSLPVSHWGDDGAQMGRDNVKFWAGSGGYPGAGLTRDALLLASGLGENALAEVAARPFAFSAPQSSSFSFDWRRSYVPLDAGFSPNAHGAVTMVGHPFVELLAAVGLEHARPERPDRSNKLAYRYAVSAARLPTLFARAVLGGNDLGFPVRRFRIQLDWPGQEGQARCIVDSREEPS